ncbi:uncharacterized protein K441DRAFT_663473 [Cenococcum geophilum 1.58]|uniref:uncharacterized protein n=1 Tax=Cenococcum geophilum 1.58 TaxID=794803 RepID=UPI00358F4AE3|nr:hypothetical protein K441DRAFT_663473 [Cenococcum geophilum 1.58]
MVSERLCFGYPPFGFRKSHFPWILIGFVLITHGLFYLIYTSIFRGHYNTFRLLLVVVNCIYFGYIPLFSSQRPDPDIALARRQAVAVFYISIFNWAAFPACIMLQLLPIGAFTLGQLILSLSHNVLWVFLTSSDSVIGYLFWSLFRASVLGTMVGVMDWTFSWT